MTDLRSQLQGLWLPLVTPFRDGALDETSLRRLVQLFGETDSIAIDTYFVYPEELKTVARVQVFRDFVVSKAQRWPS